jgi:hypothetical protein
MIFNHVKKGIIDIILHNLIADIKELYPISEEKYNILLRMYQNIISAGVSAKR